METRIYVVAKPFKTRTRRLAEGEEIGAGEIDHVLGAAEWCERGFLVEKPTEAGQDAAEF